MIDDLFDQLKRDAEAVAAMRPVESEADQTARLLDFIANYDPNCRCGQEATEPWAHDDGCPVWEKVAAEQRELEGETNE